MVSVIIGLFIEGLGHEQYRNREIADRALRVLVWVAPNQVEEARRHKDPEVAHRASRIYRPVLISNYIKAVNARKDLPALYLGGWTTEETWGYVLRAKREFGYRDGYDAYWEPWTNATKLWVIDQLIVGRSMWEVEEDLKMMVKKGKVD